MFVKASREGDSPDKTVERINFNACPRFDKHELTEAQMVEIAKKAVILAKDEFYQDVGKSVLQKLLWLLGLSVVGLYIWLKDLDKIPKT